VVSGLHALDAHVARYLDKVGQEGLAPRSVGHQAAEEIRTKGRARWASWAAARGTHREPPPWERWRNRALFPTILARVLWRGEVRDRVAQLRTKPPGTIYAVFRSIARVDGGRARFQQLTVCNVLIFQHCGEKLGVPRSERKPQ
jgi:hypothetical protein